MKKLLLIPFLWLICVSCRHNNEPVQAMKIVDVALMAPPAPEESRKQVSPSDTARKLVKDGDIRFETSDIQQTRKQIIAALKKVGGYVSEENERNNSDENRKEYVLRTRIPAKYFETFLDNAAATAIQVDSKNISIRDVTTEYIDMATRLRNKLLLETRYRDLLNKSTRMSDILQVEGKLDTIRSDIESEQGKLNYLNRQVSYSTLLITFYTKHKGQVNDGNTFGYQFKKSLGQGWDMLKDLFYGLIGIWPLLIMFTLLILAFKRWRKRKKAEQA
ncbi:MAG: DUF4349 domain-containing protein [Bacteroidota bacterium]